MKPLFAAAALIAALTGSAAAVDGKGAYTAAGAGARSCAEYAAAPEEARSIVGIWFEGYLTALNQVVPGARDHAGDRDLASLQQDLDGICAGAPKLMLADAANLVIGNIINSPKAKKAKRPKAQPAPAPAEEGLPELRR